MYDVSCAMRVWFCGTMMGFDSQHLTACVSDVNAKTVCIIGGSVCVCVRSCVRAEGLCVCVCVCACVRVCVFACAT
jgi:hypothetical protein